MNPSWRNLYTKFKMELQISSGNFFFFFLIAVAVILCTGQKPEQNLDRCSRSLPTFPIFPRDFRCPLPVSSPCHTFFS